MKVLLITVRSDFGGGPRHVDQLIQYLPTEVELYMAYPIDGEPYAKKWSQDKRIKDTIHIPYRKFSLTVLLRLGNFVRRNHIDIVHSHGNGAGIYSRILKILYPKIKVIHTFHGITDNYNNKIKKVVNVTVGRLLKPLTDQFILVSKGEFRLCQSLRALRADCSHIIYNGITPPSKMFNK